MSSCFLSCRFNTWVALFCYIIVIFPFFKDFFLALLFVVNSYRSFIVNSKQIYFSFILYYVWIVYKLILRSWVKFKLCLLKTLWTVIKGSDGLMDKVSASQPRDREFGQDMTPVIVGSRKRTREWFNKFWELASHSNKINK